MRNCPLKIRIYLNCPGLRSSLEGISLVPTISDRRLLVYYKLRPPLIGLRRISYYEAVYNPGRKNVIFRPSMTIWGRSFLLQIILMGCWTHIKQEPSNYSLALPPNAAYIYSAGVTKFITMQTLRVLVSGSRTSLLHHSDVFLHHGQWVNRVGFYFTYTYRNVGIACLVPSNVT